MSESPEARRPLATLYVRIPADLKQRIEEMSAAVGISGAAAVTLVLREGFAAIDARKA